MRSVVAANGKPSGRVDAEVGPVVVERLHFAIRRQRQPRGFQEGLLADALLRGMQNGPAGPHGRAALRCRCSFRTVIKPAM